MKRIPGALARHHPIPNLIVCLTVFAVHSGFLVSQDAVAQSGPGSTNSGPASSRPDQSQPPVTADDTPPFTTQFKGQLVVRDNRTATETTTKRIKILSRSAVQSLSQQQITFVDGMQKLETLEAFTEKPDGRHIPVDPANIITRDLASGLQATYASDAKIRTFIFSDVVVGDTLVMTLKSEILRDFFPGQLTDFEIFPRSESVTSVQYTIEAPANLDLAVHVNGNGASDKAEVVGGIQRHLVVVSGAGYRPEEPGAVSPFDREPYLAISTFHSYAELGAAYGKAALPQSKITPDIRALADDITRGITTDHRMQAAAIDAWVKSNIRYVAVYLSVGRVVPHDAATVLKNKFGDCKDKVTLMSALLSAKGIASEAVLINVGPAYSLPEPPTLAVLNHAIIYLPEFDLYDDPTANVAAFGILTPETYDKPVVRVSGAGASLARTPVMKPQDHTAHVKTTVQFAADGTISGKTEEISTGILAGGLRSAGNLLQQAGQETVIRNKLQMTNTPGTGHFDLGSSAELRDPAVIRNEFTLNDRFKAPAAGGVATIPSGMPFTVRPGNYMFGVRVGGRHSAFACQAGIQTEDIDAVFDPALPMPVPLPALNVDNAYFTYRSAYRVENRTLTMHREFTSRVSQQICPAEAEAQIAADLNKVRADVYSGYRFAAMRPADPRPPTLSEATSEIVMDQGKPIDFFYELAVDCSSTNFAAITTVEAAKHGKVSIDRGSGTSRFPRDNPRFVCNKTPTMGMTVTYQPERGFIGDDTMTLDIIYADKTSTRRHYAIKVSPARDATPKPAQIAEVSRIAVRDQKLRLSAVLDVNPDCSVVGIPAVRILEASKNGSVTLERGPGFPNYAANSPRAKCNANSVDSELIFYMPEAGYVGPDSVIVEIIYADGFADKRHYAIQVK